MVSGQAKHPAERSGAGFAVWVRPDTVAYYLVPRLGDGARVAVMVMVAVTTDPDGVREQVARDMAIVGDLPATGVAGPRWPFRSRRHHRCR